MLHFRATFTFATLHLLYILPRADILGLEFHITDIHLEGIIYIAFLFPNQPYMHITQIMFMIP